MRTPRPMMVDIDDADPADAINAFLHVLNRQRALGLCPRTEHTLAEHLFRGDAKVIFYSSASGIMSLVESDEIDDDDAFETLLFILGKKKERRARAKAKAEAASAIEAPLGGETGTGSTEGESAVPEADAQNPPQVSDNEL